MDTSDMTQKAQDWKESAEETAEELQDRARDWKQRASESARNASQKVDSYVRENTWASIATIALVSCTIGFLLGRSRD
jgi:ElaB/YqjD/DUF883 family membrane-anchored ribosome-binding protein